MVMLAAALRRYMSSLLQLAFQKATQPVEELGVAQAARAGGATGARIVSLRGPARSGRLAWDAGLHGF
jgi:hypothetical protein